MKSPLVVNGVECTTYFLRDPLLGKEVRLVIPSKVDGIRLKHALLLSHLRKIPEPESQVYLFLLQGLYESYAPCYLLYRRRFDLLSLSSPHYPVLTTLLNQFLQDRQIEPTGNVTLDNLLKLLVAGYSREPLGELLTRAIFRQPEYFQKIGTVRDFSQLEYRIFERVHERMVAKIQEEGSSLEECWDDMLPDILAVSLYLFERYLLPVYASEMLTIYGKLEAVLKPEEQALFKRYFFPNPDYLHRIPFLDVSVIFDGFFLLQAKLERGLPRNLYESYTPEIWHQIFRSYLAFYPNWVEYVWEEEREKQTKKKRMDQSVSFQRWQEEGGKGAYGQSHPQGKLPSEPEGWLRRFCSGIKLGQIPDYQTDPLFQAALNLEYPLHKDGKSPPASQDIRKRRTRSRQTYLSETQKNIVADPGVTQREIARHMGCAPSTVSRNVKPIEKAFNVSLERVVKKFVNNFMKRLKTAERKVLQDKPSILYESFERAMEAVVRIIGEVVRLEEFDLTHLEENLHEDDKKT